MRATQQKTEFRTLLIIPAYNEEGSIRNVIQNLTETVPYIDYVVVNDGSKDATLEILQKFSFNYINLPVNLGLHGAIQTGLRYAQENDYDCVIQFDGDGQHRSEYVPGLIEAIKNDECDVAIGSRYASTAKPHSLRMLGSRLISYAIYAITRTRIKDPTSGMRAYSKQLISLFSHNPNYGPEPDTIAYLILKGKKIKEVQVEMDERTAGVSYLGFSASIKYMIRMLVSITLIQPFR